MSSTAYKRTNEEAMLLRLRAESFQLLKSRALLHFPTRSTAAATALREECLARQSKSLAKGEIKITAQAPSPAVLQLLEPLSEYPVLYEAAKRVLQAGQTVKDLGPKARDDLAKFIQSTKKEMTVSQDLFQSALKVRVNEVAVFSTLNIDGDSSSICASTELMPRGRSRLILKE